MGTWSELAWELSGGWLTGVRARACGACFPVSLELSKRLHWPPGSSAGAGLTRAGAVLLRAVVLRLLAPAAPVFRSAAGASAAIACGRP
jgi:hypothetical protein